MIYLCASSRPTSPARRTQWFLAWEPSTHFGEGETVETVQRGRVGGVSAQWRQRQSQWRPRLPVRSEAEVSATPGSPHEIGCIFAGQWRGPGVVSFSEVAGLRRLRSGGGCLAGRRISPRLEPPTAIGADGRAVGTVSGARAKSRDRRLASIVKGKRTSVVLGWRRAFHTTERRFAILRTRLGTQKASVTRLRGELQGGSDHRQ